MSSFEFSDFEKSVDQFRGFSDVIFFEHVVEVARKKFGFSGTDEEAKTMFDQNENFEVVWLRDPSTQQMAWFVWDKRRKKTADKGSEPEPPQA